MDLREFLQEKAGSGEIWKDNKVTGLELRAGKRAATWYLRYRNGGASATRTLGKHPEVTLSLARARAAKILADRIIKKTTIIPELLTLRELFDAWWLDHGQYLTRAAARRRCFLREWDPYLSRPAASLTLTDINTVRRRIGDRLAVVRMAIGILRAIYYWGMQRDLVSKNPAARYKMPHQTPRKHPVPGNIIPDLLDLLEGGLIEKESANFYLMMLHTGQRPGNVMAMRHDEINGDTWTIPAKKAKTDADYHVYLPPDAMAIVADQAQRHPGNPWVFPSPNHGGMDHVKHRHTGWKKVQKTLGIPGVRIYDLRATHGTVMLNAGASIEEVSERLNHKSVITTQKYYADILMDRERAAVSKFSAALKKSRKNQKECKNI